jgi:hypothetical protein
MKMTQQQKEEITKISKQFASSFKDTFGTINGTGWLIVDPLSGYLNSIGYENKLDQLPANDKHPQILIMTFNDGSKFIPAGGDLKFIDKSAKNWMWL